MPIEIGTARSVSMVDLRIARRASGTSGGSASPAKPEPAMAHSNALDPGEPPIEVGRVTAIRRAVETGNYPLIPARVADAMIAAGLLLRNGK